MSNIDYQAAQFVIVANLKDKKGNPGDFHPWLTRVSQGASKLLTDGKVLFGVAPEPHLITKAQEIVDGTPVFIGAQDIPLGEPDSGVGVPPATPEAILGLGPKFSIIGHSYRRHNLGESNIVVANKYARVAEEEGVDSILCIGETIEERRAEVIGDVLRVQLRTALIDKDGKLRKKPKVVAYEPVWAIGTGLNATPKEIAEAHLMIVSILTNIYGSEEEARKVRIQYGGSLSIKNDEETFRTKNVHGGLIATGIMDAEECLQVLGNAVKIAAEG